MVLWGTVHIFISDFFFFPLLCLEKKRHFGGAGSAQDTALYVKEKRPLLTPPPSCQSQDLHSFTRRSCLNDRIPSLIMVKREPRYIVKAGMKFGLNKNYFTSNECTDIHCGTEDCGVLRKCHLKAQAVIHVETFWGGWDAPTAKPTSLPQTGAHKSNIWLANQMLFVCISRMYPFI